MGALERFPSQLEGDLLSVLHNNVTMKTKRMRWLVCALVIGSLPAAISAQVTPTSSTELPVSGVTLPFFVDDGHDNLVTTVTASDLTIVDGKKPAQQVAAVQAAKELPLRLGVLIDTSKSQAGSKLYGPMLAAVSDLVHQLLVGDDDKVFVVSFASVPNGTRFMNRDEMHKFKLSLTPGGGTALYDAVVLACAERMKTEAPNPSRRVLIVLSDGDDNVSHVPRARAIAAAQNSGTVIFAVSTDEMKVGSSCREIQC